MSKAVNSQVTAKKRKRGPGKPFVKDDPRINRAGAPNRGASIKEIQDFYDQLTADEVADMLPNGKLRNKFKRMPRGIALKHLKIISVQAELIDRPTAGLLEFYTERTDGKVKEELKVEHSLEVENLQNVIKQIYGESDTTNDGRSEDAPPHDEGSGTTPGPGG